MKTINVDYQRTVLADGDFVTSAVIEGADNLNLKDISFSVANKEIGTKEITKLDGGKVKVTFEEDPSLALIQFGSNFQDELIFPQIVMHIRNNDLPIETKFIEDPTIKKFETKFFQNDRTTISYYLYSSHKYNAKRPLVIFLHGSGERGYGDRYPLYGCDIPKKVAEYSEEHEDSVVLAPEATWAKELNGWFRKDIRQVLMDLIKYTVESENIDKNRIYLIGLSNGGAATWHFAENHPGLFAAIAPCCGYIFNDGKYFLTAPGKGRYMEPTDEEAERLASMPIWAFHAADDNVVNVNGTKHTVEAIRRAGNTQIKETIYKPGMCGDAPHGSWKLMAHEPDLLPWLFSQHK
ncbi:prolyl oligopeptidase family serine peptidase [uncultured Lactobacillus sp.]|uniref:carboxylesterase family protein n=1 Tax=uncultured Lactobacillus sp. TaxID=153152 RepID=UPI0028058BCD|nr:PHB depolymerase family esterase [uncultured Lactobacillus sp.]